MAKKSSTARQNAGRRTQTATKGSSGAVLLVRPTESAAESGTATAPAASAASAATSMASAKRPATKATAPAAPNREASAMRSQSAQASNPSKSAVRVTKPAPAKQAPARQATRPAAPARQQRPAGRGGRGMTAREQEVRLARARATQRARVANMISPEHYSYVLGDLRLILGVAAVFVVILIVLHFTLPQ